MSTPRVSGVGCYRQRNIWHQITNVFPGGMVRTLEGYELGVKWGDKFADVLPEGAQACKECARLKAKAEKRGTA